jgi:superfamily II DNA or RNA helicase
MQHYKTTTKIVGSIPTLASPLNQRFTGGGGQEGDKPRQGVRLRDYQWPAVQSLVSCIRGIVKAPAGSGKTIIGAAAIDAWLKSQSGKKNIAWIANTIDQTFQARKAVENFPEISERAVVDFFCYAGSGSLAEYDLVILDECHHAAAPAFAPKLRYFDGPRWGLSATPERADDLKQLVFDLIGPIIHEVPREALVDAGQLAQARVFIHSPNRKGEMESEIRNAAMPVYEARKRKWPYLFRSKNDADEQMGRCIWQAALNTGIHANQKRNALIVELAIEHAQDSTLVIVGSIEHGEALLANVPSAAICYAKLGKKKRQSLLAAFSCGELKTLFATSLADEGLDVPIASTLILASAGRSDTKTVQRTGRVLRPYPGKTYGIIHDFSDLQHYFLAAQSRKRVAAYRSLGYQIESVE